MKRLPIISSLIVALAVGAMIYLGFWQLDRLDQKEALLETYAANFDKPPMAFPQLGPVADEAMFRKSSINCLRITDWQDSSGKASNGQSGFRYIANCVTSAEGPGVLVNMGVSNRPNLEIDWQGGVLTGWITEAPGESSLLDRLMGKDTAPGPMLVADKPMASLLAPASPSIEDIPNNHLAYAVQWFLFAGIALIIFLIALRAKNSSGTK
ncbi:SURF1 family protein [Parasphingorhabdus halotolerans]|uniref:SURF1 family protein n=1 Tax=Parasphingorhabdus halotolerans TaxID=2725558 RepID=UPI001FE46076|nr:SURF1 family protein [Parasphingorhabdus halotolerans]